MEQRRHRIFHCSLWALHWSAPLYLAAPAKVQLHYKVPIRHHLFAANANHPANQLKVKCYNYKKPGAVDI